MREARKAAGLTQMEVSTALSVSQGTLSELEKTASGTTRLVDFATLYRVEPRWLATGEGPREVSASALAPPPVPPSDFRDRREVSDSDWGILEDVKLVLDKDELARIHERAEMLRQHARDWWESNIAAPAAAKTTAAPGEAKVPSPLRPSQAKPAAAKKGAGR